MFDKKMGYYKMQLNSFGKYIHKKRHAKIYGKTYFRG